MTDEAGVKDAVQDRGDEVVTEKVDEEVKDDDQGAKDDAADSQKSDAKSDAESDEKRDDDAVDTKEEKDKRIRIPKWRFDEAVSRARAREEALQSQIRDLEAKMPAKPAEEDENSIPNLEKKLETLDDQYETHLSNGEKDKAAAIRAQRRGVEREISRREVEERAYAAKEAAKNELRYEAALAKLEADYPVINPESDAYDKDVAAEVAAFRNGLVGSGISAATALERAVKRIAGAPKSAESSGKGDEVKARRDKEARDAALKATSKSPSRLDKAGVDSDKAGGGRADAAAVMRMNQEEFAKLSEEELSSMRGDVL